MNETISVVVPVYNAEKTLRRTIESIILQTKIDYIKEVIIVDDGSKDKSLEVAKELAIQYGQYVIFKIIELTNGGVARARNFGWKVATAVWVAFLDSDDFWLDKKIELEQDLLSNDEVSMFGGIEKIRKPGVFDVVVTPRKLFLKYEPLIITTVIRKSVLEALGGFDETITHSEDLDLAVRVSANYKVVVRNIVDFVANPGKSRFGDNGLSGDVLKMQSGANFVLWKAVNAKILSFTEAVFLFLIQQLKFLRRLLIILLRNKGIK